MTQEQGVGNVTNHDFGRAHRDAARQFARLAGILEKRAEEFLQDPIAFFNEAGEKIGALQMVIEKAADALRIRVERYDPAQHMRPMETITVHKAEWDRLQACARIVREAAEK
jgi:hypothetical protein